MIALKVGDIWNGVVAALRPGFWTLVTVAAPFTLLVDMVVTLFGPAPPRTLAEMTPRLVLVLVVVPGIVGAIGQLAVARLLTTPSDTPRAALAATFVAFPAYLGAVLLSVFPVGVGLLLFVVPALYLSARWFLVVPIAVTERLTPVVMLRRSWQLTEGQALPIMGFLVLALLFALGASVIAGGVGAAFGSVLKLVGLGEVGLFVNTLISALLSTFIAVASAAASSVIYLKLR